MADTRVTYTAPVTVLSTTLNSLANGAVVTSAEQSNATTKHVGLIVAVELAAATSATGVVRVFLAAGPATSKTATTASTNNLIFVGSVTVNGTTVVRSTFPPLLNPPQFYTVHLINNAGQSLASSANTVQVVGINYEIV